QMRWLLGSIAAAGAATAAATLAYATRVEPFWLQIRRVELQLRCWPRALDGLTVLHLSDLHVQSGDRYGQGVVTRAARIEADIVCLTGDFGDMPRDAPRAARLIDAARGRLGTFAVLGNHDYYEGTTKHSYHRFSDDTGFAVGATLEARGIT